MKKLSTLFVFTLGMSMMASAATFELSYEGKVLQDGATYDVGYTVEEMDLAGMKFYPVKQDCGLYLKADPSVNMTVHVSATQAKTQFCGLDNQCQSGTSISKTGNTKSNVAEDLQIDLVSNGINAMPEVPENQVTVTAYPTNNPSESVTVTVNMLAKPQAEVNSVIKVSADATAEIIYYNILGQRVEHPTKGVYIKRQGSKTTKVVFK